MTNYLTSKQFSQAKSRLTRAINSGDRQKVIDTVQAAFNAWDEGDYAYPDDWHRWERALLDAELAQRRAEW